MTGDDYVYVLYARSLVHTGEDVVVVEGIGEDSLAFLECEAAAETEFDPGERVPVTEKESERIAHVRQQLAFGDLSQVARDALKGVVTALVEDNEDQFVEFFNTAGAGSLRRHQLEFLSQVGESRRTQILEERARRPFDGFTDLSDRVQGLSDPAALVAQRIVTELSDEDISYRLFVE